MAQKSQTFTTNVDPNVVALLSEYRWTNATVTYSFPDQASDYPYTIEGFAPLSPYQRKLVQIALEGSFADELASAYNLLSSVESITNLNLQYIGETISDIAVRVDTVNGAYAALPDGTRGAGDVSLDLNNQSIYGHYVVYHELGHALGLVHGQGRMTPDRDTKEFAIMTYTDYVGDPDISLGEGDDSNGYMMYDIAALQHLYGANFNFNSTDSVYSFNPYSGDIFVNGVQKVKPFRNMIFMTLWDGGGNDTYDLTAYSNDLMVDLAPGGWSVFSQQQLANLSDNRLIKARGNVFNALQYNGDPRSLIENVRGGVGNDKIYGNAAGNLLSGNVGNDTLSGRQGNDTLYGGWGNDTLYGGQDHDSLFGGEGNDMITGEIGNDFINGESQDDALFGNDGDDTILGGSGNDQVRGGAGADSLDGGDGIDLLSYIEDTTGVSVDLRSNVVSSGIAQGDRISNFEAVEGGSGRDTIFGSHGDNRLYGLGGDDLIFGEYGIDTIWGDDGNDDLHAGNDYSADIVYGGAGNDTIYGSLGDNLLYGGIDNDVIYAGQGNDWLAGEEGDDFLQGEAGNDIILGGAGADSMHGGDGIDTLDYRADLTGVYIDVRTNSAFYGEAAGDVISGFENVLGGSGNDTLFGSSDANDLNGQDGNDLLGGGGGNDHLNGGYGDDTLYGGTGDDTLWGSFGNDTLSGDDGNDFLAGGETGNDHLNGGYGDDTLFGGTDQDTLWGSFGNDTLYGEDGNDFVAGGEDGNDYLNGGAGNDTLYGGTGDDRLVGGAGNDTLVGEQGRDTFVFDTALDGVINIDEIVDFDVTEDLIELSRSIFDEFDDWVPLFVGAGATTGGAQILYDITTGDLYYDPDGVGSVPQYQFARLAAGLPLSSSNFVLA